MCSRQTSSSRQISLTPPYPEAQSILIKKRFWLLYRYESQSSFIGRSLHTEAASSISDVKLNSRLSAPAPSVPNPPPNPYTTKLGRKKGPLGPHPPSHPCWNRGPDLSCMTELLSSHTLNQPSCLACVGKSKLCTACSMLWSSTSS